MSVTIIYKKKLKGHKKKYAKKLGFYLFINNFKIFNFMAGSFNTGSTGTLVVIGQNDANVDRPIKNVVATSSNEAVVTVTPIPDTNNFALHFVGEGSADIHVTAQNFNDVALEQTINVTVATPVQEATHLVLNITQP